MSLLYEAVFGQCEIERGTPVDRALRPDAPAVTIDDALDRGQTHASSWEFGRRMKPLEGAEESGGIGGVESGTVVTDKIGRCTVVTNLAKFNAS